jgi:hypothetical protein
MRWLEYLRLRFAKPEEGNWLRTRNDGPGQAFAARPARCPLSPVFFGSASDGDFDDTEPLVGPGPAD